MTEIVTDLEKAKNLLENTRKRLKKLKKTPFLKRGSQDNEDILKLTFREKQLKSAIKLIKKKKPITNKELLKELIPIPKKKKERSFNGEYF